MWSSTPPSVPHTWRFEGGLALAGAINCSANKFKQKPAYIWRENGNEDCILSFEDAHNRASFAAATIRASGVTAGKLTNMSANNSFMCGIILKRSSSLPIGQLAAFKAGATFVPCDPTWPVDRTVSIISEANCSVVLVDADNLAAALELLASPTCSCECALLMNTVGEIVDILTQDKDQSHSNLYASRDEALQQMEAVTLPPEGAKPREDTAAATTLCWSPPEVMYVMYTSGSTGKPKGCVVPTSGVWHRLRWGEGVLGLSCNDTFVLKTPSTFDCSIPEMWAPMVLGCTCVVVPDGAHLDFEVVKDCMEAHAVTVAHFVPSVLALFLDFVSEGDLPALRQISCTGEALLLSHREKLTKKVGRPLPLINLYGPTEASVEVTYFDAKDDLSGAAHGFPIGFPGDEGVKVYVTDPNDPQILVAPGEKGEVCLGGIQVAYGYLNRADLTSSRFLPNPHGHPGLLYRTGDLGILGTKYDGALEYHGRTDRQVKVGGVRIELGEIEAVCLKVFAQSLLNIAVEKVEYRLVGVAAPRPGCTAPPSASELNEALAAALPKAYVPSEWHFRDALPLGSAGKVDHNQVVSWIKDQSKAAMWGSIYDELYFANDFQVDDGVDDPTMDWAAYTDSFTNEMHERPTIAEWVDETAKEVLAKQPKKVVEMGCGKGMILFKVAAAECVEEYVGCDLSRLAVKHVERVWKSHIAPPGSGSRNEATRLETHVRDASNFGGLGDEKYDAIICNGVSMYFPSASYLVDVLQAGLPKLKPSCATYHFGDVISRDHYKSFLLRRARIFTHSFEELQEERIRGAIFAAAKDRCFEQELFFALHMAGKLPGVAAVEVQLKQGSIMSEFNRYRYNVLLHMGEVFLGHVSPHHMEVLEVPSSDAETRKSATSIAEALKSLAGSKGKDKSNRIVVACHGILNARLSADALLRSGIQDANAPPVQTGVGEGGGVDPPDLREALESVLSGYHVVLQWARDGIPEHMDVYAIPIIDGAQAAHSHPSSTTAGSGKLLAAGLDAVMRSAVALIDEKSLIERAHGNKVESFTNQLMTVDKESGGSNDSKKNEADSEAAVSEAKKLWFSTASVSESDNAAVKGSSSIMIDKVSKRAAVLMLLGAKLNLGSGSAMESDSFASLGGNSFVAMQTIGAIRALFGVAMPVFELLTKTFGEFADAVVAKALGKSSSAMNADTQSHVGNDIGNVSDSWITAVDESATTKGESLSPTFVFFPQAGSSPKQYAALFRYLKAEISHARYLFVQPPGRDIREDEENESNLACYVSSCTRALAPYVIDCESRSDQPVLFIGDSWGAIAAFATAHELRAKYGWFPTHMLVSGNASPSVTSSHNGLGSFSTAPMKELSDNDLAQFLLASGVDDAKRELLVGSPLLAAFRADCQLYEDYKRPPDVPKLPSQLCVLRGREDDVVSMSEVCGWVDEFNCPAVNFVNIPNATHHVHEEEPQEVAKHIISFLKLQTESADHHKKRLRIEVSNVPTVTSNSQGRAQDLPPPCSFIRGVDKNKLRAFRQGNWCYRLGSPQGSKGELSSVAYA